MWYCKGDRFQCWWGSVNSSGKHLKIPYSFLKEQNRHLQVPRLHQGNWSLALESAIRKALTHRQTDRQERQGEPCDRSSSTNPKGRRPSALGSLAFRLLVFLHRAEIKLCGEKQFQENTPPTVHWSTGLWLAPHLLFPLSPWWARVPHLDAHARRLRSMFSVCSLKLYLGMRQASVCVSPYRRCSREGERRRACQQQAAAEVKRVGLKKKISLLGQKEIFQSILIVKWFLFFRQCPTWVSLGSVFASRSCCTGAKPQRSWLYLWPPVQNNPWQLAECCHR